MTFKKMTSKTTQERVQIVELFYENQRSVKSVSMVIDTVE